MLRLNDDQVLAARMYALKLAQDVGVCLTGMDITPEDIIEIAQKYEEYLRSSRNREQVVSFEEYLRS